MKEHLPFMPTLCTRLSCKPTMNSAVFLWHTVTNYACAILLNEHLHTCRLEGTDV